ncbi:PREDICTED: polymerase delta-interacting protein 2-like isoform X1 [Amphimedon queenslandica]|uniref:ApaG domain-containing protein n=1 Tax=Amphimedon queenslandica TaxID=400682 RepID=A0A1X7VHD5_AMPQE|nr:PREDICTED: polymerase delta-interacting protein 2-like isoform X1 [Amphimedon queenslandica]|eukprot:XP_019848719.1 PREDICTED: polymerase delta-interacting protein 2-like isoform X1 [Amphimedon queenslandica]
MATTCLLHRHWVGKQWVPALGCWNGLSSSRGISSSRLIEIGCMNKPKLYESYSSGQHFLHRVFGYRGVILFHWVSRVYDHDRHQKPSNVGKWDEDCMSGEVMKELKPEHQTFYQVLIDQRDISQRTSRNAVTLSSVSNKKKLYCIPGLDYVNHEDILPYTPSPNALVQHKLFQTFFSPSTDGNSPIITKDFLSSWHQKHICWLERIEIHRETTFNIRITVMPFYMGAKVQDEILSTEYWWQYCIRLENISGSTVQLRKRHWRIYNRTESLLETVKGEGVVGQQPILSIRQPAYQYNSHVSLKQTNGLMWGTFQMEREDGFLFDIRIPPFSLEETL